MVPDSESGAAIVDDEGGGGREAAVVALPLRPAGVRHRSSSSSSRLLGL